MGYPAIIHACNPLSDLVCEPTSNITLHYLYGHIDGFTYIYREMENMVFPGVDELVIDGITRVGVRIIYQTLPWTDPLAQNVARSLYYILRTPFHIAKHFDTLYSYLNKKVPLGYALVIAGKTDKFAREGYLIIPFTWDITLDDLRFYVDGFHLLAKMKDAEEVAQRMVDLKYTCEQAIKELELKGDPSSICRSAEEIVRDVHRKLSVIGNMTGVPAPREPLPRPEEE